MSNSQFLAAYNLHLLRKRVSLFSKDQNMVDMLVLKEEKLAPAFVQENSNIEFKPRKIWRGRR